MTTHETIGEFTVKNWEINIDRRIDNGSIGGYCNEINGGRAYSFILYDHKAWQCAWDLPYATPQYVKAALRRAAKLLP